MAEFWTENVTHRSVEFGISGLDGAISDYDKFVLIIEQNNITIYEYTFMPEDFDNPNASGFYIELDKPDFLGYNFISPKCDYTAYVDCYKDDELYAIYDIDFTTEEINPPSVPKITPDVYVAVRDQGDYETCVADSLACAMDIFKARESGVYYENFSTAYIYGTDGDRDEGMIFDEAIDNCFIHGSPRWEISSGFFPDSMWEDEASELFTSLKADITIYNHAKKQKFKYDSYECNVDFYDCESVADAIESNGYFMFNFRIPENFYEGIGSDGIIPQPDEYSGVNHSMALIGLTVKNGKKHWIAQNSWGEKWGDNGYCYIPYDWGCGVQAPLYKTDDGKKSPEFGEPTSWTLNCYAPSPDSGYADSNPHEVYNIYAELPQGTSKQVYLSWESDIPDCKYYVLMRQSGTEKWDTKAVTSDTFSHIKDIGKYATYEFMVISNDVGYSCSPQSEIIEIEVIDTSSPKKWEWESPMDEDLEIVMSDTLDCPVVRPITALEWDEFRGCINAIREYNDVDPFHFQYDITGESYGFDADSTIFTPEIYNEAAEAIREMMEYLISIGFEDAFTDDDSNAVSDIDKNTILSASLFIGLRDVLNKCI